ncbi:D-erythronate dehydrogenase, partial [Bradyrhizobium sp. Lot11]
MHVMILGAAGMVGRKLVERIAREPLVFGRPVARLTLA